MTNTPDQDKSDQTTGTDLSQPSEKKRTDYTEGSIMRAIVKMGLPSMAGFLVQHVYIMIDTYWVSTLSEGESAVAALTFFNGILWFFFSFNQLVGPGSVAIISRRYGEKEWDRAEKAIKETIILKLFFGALIGIAGYLSIGQMLSLMGAEGLALERGIEYGQVMFIFVPVLFATYSIFTAMRGVSNPNMALGLMLGSSLLNMAIDPIFIFGYLGMPALGMKGAAVASVLSFSLTFIVGLLLFYRGATNVQLHLSGEERLSLESMWKMVKIGVPAWLGGMSFSGSRLLIMPMIAGFGMPVVAAYGIGLQIFSFGVMVLVGIGLGVSALIGQTLGAGKTERARKTGDRALLMGTAFMAIFGLVVYIFARVIVSLFLENPETIEHGVTLLRIITISFPFIGAYIMLEEIHMGVGLNLPTMIVSIIHSWGLQVLPILIVTELFGLDQVSVWWILTSAGFVSSTVFYLYYRRGRWLTVKV